MKPEIRLKEKQYNFTLVLIITLFAFLIIHITKLPKWILGLLIMGLWWLLFYRLFQIRSELMKPNNPDVIKRIPKRG